MENCWLLSGIKTHTTRPGPGFEPWISWLFNFSSSSKHQSPASWSSLCRVRKYVTDSVGCAQGQRRVCDARVSTAYLLIGVLKIGRVWTAFEPLVRATRRVSVPLTPRCVISTLLVVKINKYGHMIRFFPFGNSLEPHTGINSKLAKPVSCTNAQLNVYDLGTADRIPQPRN